MRRNTSAAAAAFLVTVAAAGLAQEPDARTFRPGAMAERTAEASGYCGQRGAGAALVGVDHLIPSAPTVDSDVTPLEPPS